VTASRARRAATAAAVGLVAILASGCVVTDGGYGYAGGGYGVDYYQPSGAYYGGWAPGYRVAPYRGSEHREEEHRPAAVGGRPPAHAYKAAPPSRAMPSIPSHARPAGQQRR
jgi:hypothetical protein